MSRRTQRNVGVIGLGIIGRRVADALRHRGFPTFVWNRTPRPFPNFVGSPAEIAELCDFVQIFVSDDDALLQVVQGMKRSLGAAHIVMAHSTVAPATMRAAAEIVQRRGAQLLDAPFTGSKMAAEKGELVYYVGGDEAAYRRARPVLEATSKQIVEIGEIGQATAIKLATNMITAATVQAAAEALALLHHSGMGLEKFFEAMQANGSHSGTLEMKLPKMLAGDFEPHFSVKHMLKDIELATRLARTCALSLPGMEVARESLLEQARQGRTEEDYSAIARIFFPDGAPGKVESLEPETEEQVDLTLEETPAVEQPAPEPEPIADVREETEITARNGEAPLEAEPEPEETPPVETNTEASRVEELPKHQPSQGYGSAGEKEEEEEKEKKEERRGFLSRLFRSMDY